MNCDECGALHPQFTHGNAWGDVLLLCARCNRDWQQIRDRARARFLVSTDDLGYMDPLAVLADSDESAAHLFLTGVAS